MKTTFVLVVLVAFVACANSQGFPTKTCPAGEHSVLYCPQKAEPTCDDPTVHDLDGPAACGIPQCFCDDPTVRNTCSGKCVYRSQCPNK